MIQDGVPINTLERAVSDDVVFAQELIAREATEIAQLFARQNYVATDPTHLTRAHVASGLQFRVSAGQLKMNKGVLGQYNVTPAAPDVPAPAALDSPYYRIGFQFNEVNITDPWDATNAWWLLEARVVQVATLNENRDVYNPALGTFAAAGPFDKQYENQIETQWIKGTATTIAAHTAGWAPIGAVYRAAGGGAIAISDVIMLSLQREDIDPNAYSTKDVCRRDSFRFFTPVSPGADVEMSLAGSVQGLKCFAHTDTTLTRLRTAAYIDPGDIGLIAVADIWWYVYLVPVMDDKVPQGQYGATGPEHRGCIVCSRVPPNDHGVNGAAIDVPDPIGGTANAGEAVHLGVFRASGVGNNIYYIDISDSGEGRVNEWQFLNNAFPMNWANNYQAGAHNLAVTGPGGLEDVPYGVHLKCFAETFVLDDVGAAGFAASVTWAMVGSDTFQTYLGWRNITRYLFELTPKGGSLVLTLATTSVTTALAVLGWLAGDVGNNAHIAGLWGIRF